jgi:hypothetical protein
MQSRGNLCELWWYDSLSARVNIRSPNPNVSRTLLSTVKFVSSVTASGHALCAMLIFSCRSRSLSRTVRLHSTIKDTGSACTLGTARLSNRMLWFLQSSSFVVHLNSARPEARTASSNVASSVLEFRCPRDLVRIRLAKRESIMTLEDMCTAPLLCNWTSILVVVILDLDAVS